MTSSKLSELKKAVNLERLNDGHVITLIECLETAKSALDEIAMIDDTDYGFESICITALKEIESKLGGCNG